MSLPRLHPTSSPTHAASALAVPPLETRITDFTGSALAKDDAHRRIQIQLDSPMLSPSSAFKVTIPHLSPLPNQVQTSILPTFHALLYKDVLRSHLTDLRCSSDFTGRKCWRAKCPQESFQAPEPIEVCRKSSIRACFHADMTRNWLHGRALSIRPLSPRRLKSGDQIDGLLRTSKSSLVG